MPKPSQASDARDTAGVYADLKHLVRLQYKARGASFLPRQPVTSVLAGRHGSRLRGRGLNFEEIRRYLPGDDIRTLDWKVTARLREPHVRVYTEERDRPAILLIDQRQSMFFGSRVRMKSVTAAELAALSAWRVLDRGDRVGAIVFDDESLTEIRPQRSRRTVLQILRETVRRNHALRIDGNTTPSPAMLNRALEQAARLAKHDSLVVLIGDAMGADDDSVRHVTRMSRHNDVIIGFVYDPLETGIPDAGTLVVGERDLQMELDTAKRGLREGFAKQFEERLAWVTRISREREAGFLPITTVEDVAEQARRLLGHRPPKAPATKST